MESSANEEREVRAARNQSLFRAINPKLEALNEAFEQVTGTLNIACECADMSCVEMLEIEPREYDAVRREPRQFVVLRGHVYLDVQKVVCEVDGYVVVEKPPSAAEEIEKVLGSERQG